MAIYRTLYYGDVTVGVGGRITIPQEIRDDLRLEEGNVLTVRVEEAPGNTRQMVLWRTEVEEDFPSLGLHESGSFNTGFAMPSIEV